MDSFSDVPRSGGIWWTRQCNAQFWTSLGSAKVNLNDCVLIQMAGRFAAERRPAINMKHAWPIHRPALKPCDMKRQRGGKGHQSSSGRGFLHLSCRRKKSCRGQELKSFLHSALSPVKIWPKRWPTCLFDPLDWTALSPGCSERHNVPLDVSKRSVSASGPACWISPWAAQGP